jgi:uncharacterized membrane protein (DUF373 family)
MIALGEKLLQGFERAVIGILLVLLCIMVAIGTLMLIYLLVNSIGTRLGEVGNALELQEVMQRGFGAVLVVLLGLELLETIRQYTAEHRVRVEVVFFVGLIAVGRHVIQIDYLNASIGELLGTAAIVLALATGYFLVRRGSGLKVD